MKEKESVDFDQNTFFEFEEKYNLFSRQTNDLYYWDLVRFELFYHLLWNHESNVKKIKLNVSVNQIFKEIKSFFNFVLFKKSDFLFFTTSRNKIGNDAFFDQNLGDILNSISGNYYAFESYERDRSKWYYENTLFNPINIFKRITRLFYRQNEDYSDLISLINNEFSNASFSNQDINRLVSDFKIERAFYTILLSLKKTKVIFITQNGIQKGLFAAGKKKSIPIIEVQHGIIDEAHLAYNYSKKIDYKDNQLYLPTYFFTFSDFWAKNLYLPVNDIISMGNSYFFYAQNNNLIKEQNKNINGLLVASSDIFGENLKEIVIDFATKNKNIPIYFKLHPNQFLEKQYYIEKFSKFENVAVYTNEKSVYELLEMSKAVLVIQSTALYEAYHLKKTGFIYKKQTYRRHHHVFDLPNINLINNANEIIEAFNKEFVVDDMNENLFFKTFDSNKFDQFMNRLLLVN